MELDRRTFIGLTGAAVTLPFIRIPSVGRPPATDESVPIGTIAQGPNRFSIYTDFGWVRCNGQFLSKDDYPELAQVLQGVYGETNSRFAVPDLKKSGRPG